MEIEVVAPVLKVQRSSLRNWRQRTFLLSVGCSAQYLVDKIMVYVIVASFSEIVQDTIAITIHNLIKEMYDWSGWHVGTGSRMMSCTAEARVEGRRHSHHPSHHQQGDGRVRVQVESVLGRFTLPSTTFHRHPHCTCVTQRAPNTGTSTYARKSWGGHPWVIWHRKVPPSGLWVSGSASTWQ